MTRLIWICLLWPYIFCFSFNARAHTKARTSTHLFSSVGINDCLVVLSADAVLDTVEHRSQLGLEAALCAWPSLKVEKEVLLQDPTWLLNKLKALSHVLDAPSASFSTTCEFALAARLLLEEQALDEGESNNKRGKYASKFHPQGIEDSPSSAEPSSSSTRPLTVGEIAANWDDFFRETLQMRYHANYKDPIPVLQSIIDEKIVDWGELPVFYPQVQHTLNSKRYQNFVMTVPPSDKQLVRQSLEGANVSFIETASALVAIESLSLETNRRTVVVLESDESSLQDILNSSIGETVIVVIDGSYKRLEAMASLFGDSIPRQGNIGNTPFQKKLSLNLGKWACGHPTTVAKATMNPWTDVMTMEALQDNFLSGQNSEEAFQ
ncbi:unnamed protein product [Cylindrotheca closterium]|uniref:Uncharacterized protein n=1 Tax=Cylindrotheca closterium TaxID=2856 RepID=A0AAD2G9P2_9STRA|nr:unnamed protein product [Cylindrotheca closterium]